MRQSFMPYKGGIFAYLRKFPGRMVQGQYVAWLSTQKKLTTIYASFTLALVEENTRAVALWWLLRTGGNTEKKRISSSN